MKTNLKTIFNPKNRKKYTTDVMKSLLKKAKPLSWFEKGKTIEVHNFMQKNYSYKLSARLGKQFDERFKPQLTPQQMLLAGAFEGKYLNDCILEYPREWFEKALKKGVLSPNKANIEINRFKIKSRMGLKDWRNKKWIIKPDPRGWFEWYCRYYLGRRIPEVDEKQIKRWVQFKRHVAQVEKNCQGDLKCRPRQRQALLQWAYNPLV